MTTEQINWVTFGDSVTWYDGQQYLDFTKAPKTKCIGYQHYLDTYLNIKISNQGASGNTTQDIYQRSKLFDYTNYDGVSFFMGINNFNKGNDNDFGEIKPVGSIFDVQTFCGAYQATIEDVIQRYSNKKIFLIAPYKVLKKERGLLPINYSHTIERIAQIYKLPLCNLYSDSDIDPILYPNDFVDDYNTVQYLYHVNNIGYKKISNILVPFFSKNL